MTEVSKDILEGVLARKCAIPRYAAADFELFLADVKTVRYVIEESENSIVSMAVFVSALLECATSWGVAVFGPEVDAKSENVFVATVLNRVAGGKKVTATYVSNYKLNTSMLVKLEKEIDAAGPTSTLRLPTTIKHLGYGAFNQATDSAKLAIIRSIEGKVTYETVVHACKTRLPFHFKINKCKRKLDEMYRPTKLDEVHGCMIARHAKTIDFECEEYDRIVEAYKKSVDDMMRAV